MIVDEMKTYSQYLAAQRLSEILLMKYAREVTRGTLVLHDDEAVEEQVQMLADRLGYRLMRIVPKVSPTREPVAQAAE